MLLHCIAIGSALGDDWFPKRIRSFENDFAEEADHLFKEGGKTLRSRHYSLPQLFGRCAADKALHLCDGSGFGRMRPFHFYPECSSCAARSPSR